MWTRGLAVAAVALCSCARSPIHELPASADSSTFASQDSPRHIRSTGTVQAVRVQTITVPQIRGPGGQLTLTRLISNGTLVKAGSVIAELDKVQQMHDSSDARAKVDDLRRHG